MVYLSWCARRVRLVLGNKLDPVGDKEPDRKCPRVGLMELLKRFVHFQPLRERSGESYAPIIEIPCDDQGSSWGTWDSIRSQSLFICTPRSASNSPR